eukprot:Nk52_evm1s391 gene=Nk52_evmTU1s391
MFSLFQKYDVKYTTDAERVVNGGVKFKWVKKEEGAKNNVVRVFPLMRPNPFNENFCKREVLTYTKFRELPQGNFCDIYQANAEIVRPEDAHENNEGDNDEDDFEFEGMQLRMRVPAHAQIYNTRNYEEEDADLDERMAGPYVYEADNDCERQAQGRADARHFTENVLGAEYGEMGPAEGNFTEDTLNEKQRLVYKHAIACGVSEDEAMRLVLYGEGGTGKSHVIHTIRNASCDDDGNDTVLVC